MSPLLAALLHLASYLDISEEPAVDSKATGEALARMGLYVQRLDDDSIDAIASELEALADYAKEHAWPPEAIDFIEAFLVNCGFRLEVEDGEEDDDEGDDEDEDEEEEEEE